MIKDVQNKIHSPLEWKKSNSWIKRVKRYNKKKGVWVELMMYTSRMKDVPYWK